MVDSKTSPEESLVGNKEITENGAKIIVGPAQYARFSCQGICRC